MSTIHAPSLQNMVIIYMIIDKTINAFTVEYQHPTAIMFLVVLPRHFSLVVWHLSNSCSFWVLMPGCSQHLAYSPLHLPHAAFRPLPLLRRCLIGHCHSNVWVSCTFSGSFLGLNTGYFSSWHVKAWVGFWLVFFVTVGIYQCLHLHIYMWREWLVTNVRM